jgi:CubicO group peptidase (beta-lactamase class C family)
MLWRAAVRLGGLWALGVRLRVLVFGPWIPVVIGAIVCVTAEALPRTPPPPQISASPLDLDAIAKAAGDLPRLHSLLVSWRGSLIVERYFNGAPPARLANIKSASKSIISALVGIAIERRLIAGVQQPIAPFFRDQLGREPDPRTSQITIENLLTMQSGLASTSNRNYGAWVQSPNWVRHVLSRPIESEPGTTMRYSTGNTHLLSAILTKVSGKSTWQLAQETLAGPLGFSLAEWPRDPQSVYFGGNDMLLTPRQMLAFGELYLHRGRANERQIVPATWVEASLIARTRSNISGQDYGYGWWSREMAGVRAFFAWGFGGQFIFVVPALDLTIVSTSAATVSDDRRSHRLTVDALIERLVVAPISALAP